MTILINGGGIGGLSAAISLAHHGISSRVLEQTAEFSEVGAGIQIGPNGMRILENWGVLELLRGRGAIPSAIRIFDGLSGKKLNEVPLGEYAQKRYGAPYKVFHRAELQMALLEKARTLPKITITTGFRAREFAELEDCVAVQSVSGQEVRGDLLIGADGLWSTIRHQMFPGITPTFYGKSAWRAIVPMEQAPAPFNKLATGLWMAPNAHMVHYPVMGGRSINVVAVITEQFNKAGWTTPGQSDELLSHYENWAPVPRNFLHSITGWQKWALFGLEHLPHWSQGRTVLLGDAAHPPIPFLAQGGVMAIEDAFVLAAELEKHGSNHADAFTSYENLRRDRAYRVMDTAHKLGKIYHMKGFMRRARNAVLSHKNSQKLLADYDWLYGQKFEKTT